MVAAVEARWTGTRRRPGSSVRARPDARRGNRALRDPTTGWAFVAVTEDRLPWRKWKKGAYTSTLGCLLHGWAAWGLMVIATLIRPLGSRRLDLDRRKRRQERSDRAARVRCHVDDPAATKAAWIKRRRRKALLQGEPRSPRRVSGVAASLLDFATHYDVKGTRRHRGISDRLSDHLSTSTEYEKMDHIQFSAVTCMIMNATLRLSLGIKYSPRCYL